MNCDILPNPMSILSRLGHWLIAISDRPSKTTIPPSGPKVDPSLAELRHTKPIFFLSSDDLLALVETIAQRTFQELRDLTVTGLEGSRACVPPCDPLYFMVACSYDCELHGLATVLASGVFIDAKFLNCRLYKKVRDELFKKRAVEINSMELWREQGAISLNADLNEVRAHESLFRLSQAIGAFALHADRESPYVNADLFNGTFVLGRLCNKSPWRQRLAAVATENLRIAREELAKLKPKEDDL